MPKDGTGKPETLVAYTTRSIKTAIAEGRFPPGSRLSPSALAAELDVSHIPVREALRSLTASGYIEHRQAQGFFTRELTSSDLSDIYRLREILETEAYTMAVPKITDGDVEEMRRVNELMKKHTSPDHRLQYLDLNREFHFVAFERTGSDRLLTLLNYLWDVAAPYGAAEPVDSTRSYRHHQAMIKKFAARDTDGVIDAMSDHRQVRLRHIEEWEGARTRKKAAPATGSTS
ncbi:GntR family transcriptional regulator [Streptomyces sp. NPDC002790]|uniref:GntR family transcriptional regulator n=1 Tax=Streptomyces sp. NPDC002790 TaxID=3154431 RepID=UPI00331F4EF1